MAALAYVLLPLSGLVAFLFGSSPRLRFHGLQAIFVGLVWGVAAYLAAVVAPTVTVAVFALGALLWVVLMVTTLLGWDLRLPGANILEGIASATAERSSD